MDGNDGSQDGRHLRAERHRAQIIQAMIELMRETSEVPGADAIAERAEVSPRSVFRLFDDRASLVRSVFECIYSEVAEHYPFPDLSGVAPRDRLTGLVRHLTSVYEYIAPFRLATESRAGDRSVVQAEHEQFRAEYGERARSVVRGTFPGIVSSDQIVRDSLRLALSWNAWSFVRFECGRSVKHARAVVLHNVVTILRAAGAELPRNQTGRREEKEQRE